METKLSAAAAGIATFAGDTVLDAYFPTPTLGNKPIPQSLTVANHASDLVTKRVVEVVITDLSQAPTDALDAYLRLHLLSHRLVAPQSIDLDGIFGLLANVAWTATGPIPVEHAATYVHDQRSRGIAEMILGVIDFHECLIT